MKRLSIFIIYFCIFTALPMSAFSYPTNWGDIRPALITPLKLDEVQIGEVWINPKAEAIYIDKSQLNVLLKEILSTEVFDKLNQNKSKSSYYTSRDLAQHGIKLSFNANDLKLNIHIPLALRKSRELNLQYYSNQNSIEVLPSEFSTFLNFDYGKSFENFEESGETLYNELNINYKGHILSSGGFYRSESVNKNYVREYSRYIYDFEKQHSRLILGDIDYNTVDLQEQIQGAGISIQNNFSINPRLLRTNTNRYEIELSKPSLVEIFLNEARIYNSYHAAGVLNLNSLPLIIGQNTIKIMLTDNNGRRETLYYNTNYHSNLLPKGLSHYAANILSPSSQNSTGDLEYDTSSNIYSGFYRYGVSENTTLGFNYQNFESNSLTGLELSRSFNYFLTELFPSISNYQNQERISLHVGVQSIPFGAGLEKVHARASFRHYQKDFASIQGELTNIKNSYTTSLSYALNSKSTLGLSFDKNELYLGDEQSYVNLELLHRFNGYMNISLRGRQDLTENNDNSVFIAFNWSEPLRKFTGNHNYQSQTKELRNQLSYQEHFDASNLYISTGYDKNLETTDSSTRLFSQLQTAYGNFRLDHSETNNARSSNINLRFAIAMTGESLNLTPYINNSFVIFESDSSNEISIPGQFTQVVSRNSQLSRVNLIPYTQNRFEFDVGQLPFGEDIRHENINIKPTYKSGTYYKIETQKTLSISFRLILNSLKNSRYKTGLIYNDNEQHMFMTGKTGKGFVSNISPGLYSLKLDSYEKVIKLTIPKNSGYITLGDIQYEN